MQWQIPAKTFLLGEYAALVGESAIILTTTPAFSLTIANTSSSCFHPSSPAGKYWLNTRASIQNLLWDDPYFGLGGMGASSAQFIGAFLADNYLTNQAFDCQQLLTAYYQFAWSGEGCRPSGYDVLAQTQHKCVYINQKNNLLECLDWPFDNLSFLLLRTGNKLATHQHLQDDSLSGDYSHLADIVNQAKTAFEHADGSLLINSINKYQQELTQLKLTTAATLEKINQLKKNRHLLAIKGCGALGADILLLVFPREELVRQTKKLTKEGWIVLANENNLYKGEVL